MIKGGGGGTSSKAGGANEGARRRCIGRGLPSGSFAICACGGRARPPEPLVKLRDGARPVTGLILIGGAVSPRSRTDW